MALGTSYHRKVKVYASNGKQFESSDIGFLSRWCDKDIDEMSKLLSQLDVGESVNINGKRFTIVEDVEIPDTRSETERRNDEFFRSFEGGYKSNVENPFTKHNDYLKQLREQNKKEKEELAKQVEEDAKNKKEFSLDFDFEELIGKSIDESIKKVMNDD